jgi:hypothetical protein
MTELTVMVVATMIGASVFGSTCRHMIAQRRDPD